MDKSKRIVLQGIGLSLAGLGIPMTHAQAQAVPWNPTRPLTIVVPAPPGGGSDSMARAMGDLFSKELGQPVVIDNKPGAGGTIGAQAVARAPADGHTVLFAHSAPIYYAPYLFNKLAYDPGKDLAFISYICDGVPILVMHPDVPAQNMKELVAWIQQKGKGKVSYGSYGIGSVSHLLSAYLSESRGLGMTHVPYRGEAPAVQDVLRGEVPFAIISVGSVIQHINAGKLKAIVNFDRKRMPELPNVPTMAEAGFTDPEFQPIGGVVMMAPAGTPPAVIARIEAVTRTAVQTPQMKAIFKTYGVVPIGSTAEEARKAFETTKPALERLVRLSGAKLE